MYARVVNSQLQPGKARSGSPSCVIRLSQQPNNSRASKGFVVLADPNSDKGIAYSIWETEADLKASETSHFDQQIAKRKVVLAAPPVHEIHELIVLA